jgi:DNA-binding MarR family transcriptional regulator
MSRERKPDDRRGIFIHPSARTTRLVANPHKSLQKSIEKLSSGYKLHELKVVPEYLDQAAEF